MLFQEEMKIDSVEPSEGKEGTIITIRGSGFGKHPRSNCIVVGGMGACARVLEGGNDREIQARIDPVARPSEGHILAWPGVGTLVFADRLKQSSSSLDFAEIAIFKNGAPQTEAPGKFRLTEASDNTFGGFQETARDDLNLRGFERGNFVRIEIPRGFECAEFRSVDICAVLKEPTTTLDFTAAIEGEDTVECVKAIAKAIETNFSVVGVEVFCDVKVNRDSGAVELFVSKPYLERSMVTVHFSSDKARSSAS